MQIWIEKNEDVFIMFCAPTLAPSITVSSELLTLHIQTEYEALPRRSDLRVQNELGRGGVLGQGKCSG